MTEPLRVFGSASKFRAALKSRAKTGEVDLTGHVQAAAAEVDALPPRPPEAEGLARILWDMQPAHQLSSVESRIGKWLVGNYRLIERQLGSAAAKEVAPYRSTRAKPNLSDLGGRVEWCKAELADGLAGLRVILDRLPASPHTTVRTLDDRFMELRQSGLIEETVLVGYVRRMEKTRTRVQWSDAIGAAKELVEAANIATLDKLGVPYAPGDFAGLGKTVRKEVLKREVPTAKSGKAIDQLFAGLATVELALGTLRNDVGSGHGKTNLPKGLRARHAQLAIDIADTHTRYLLATLADLKIL